MRRERLNLVHGVRLPTVIDLDHCVRQSGLQLSRELWES